MDDDLARGSVRMTPGAAVRALMTGAIDYAGLLDRKSTRLNSSH